MTNPQALLSNFCRIAALAAVAITPAFAVEVTYNTTGQFGSSGTNVYTGANSLKITYGNSVGDTVFDPFPTNTSFGTFTVIDPTVNHTDAISTTFSLTITQTDPSALSETLTGTFAGSIGARFAAGMPRGSSSVVLTFTGGSGAGGAPVLGTDPLDGAKAYTFSLGGVVYFVDDVTPIEPQTTNMGLSTINGTIDASAVPEPAFYTLTGLGFAGLMAMAIRRRRQQIVS